MVDQSWSASLGPYKNDDQSWQAARIGRPILVWGNLILAATRIGDQDWSTNPGRNQSWPTNPGQRGSTNPDLGEVNPGSWQRPGLATRIIYQDWLTRIYNSCCHTYISTDSLAHTHQRSVAVAAALRAARSLHVAVLAHDLHLLVELTPRRARASASSYPAPSRAPGWALFSISMWKSS